MNKFLIPNLVLILLAKWSSQSDSDIDSIILKYSSNKKFQMDTFYENFKQMLNKTNSFECFESKSKIIKSSQILDKRDFLVISSILISKLDQCYNKNFSLKETNVTNEILNKTNFLDTFLGSEFYKLKSVNKQALFYSLVSVFSISFIGVLCIIVVPVLNNFCFSYLFQFLTALALGTLTGDALLHLVPHAFMTNESSNHLILHKENISKGLAIVMGLYIFFLAENLMKFYQFRKEKIRERKELMKNLAVNERIKKHELDLLIENSKKFHEQSDNSTSNKSESGSSFYDNGIELTKASYPKNELINSKKGKHVHSHSHTATKSSIMMIILGDILHNFSDGLAIGVSFSSSITTGIGTSLAIFFHELPHEIGDFAVLRKNGYSMRKALFINILSSFLCFLGVIFGLALGSIEKFSNWSFLFIAGSFIYISLVDLIPELNEPTDNGNFLILLLQNLGILFGFGLMLTIAIFEDELVRLFEK